MLERRNDTRPVPCDDDGTALPGGVSDGGLVSRDETGSGCAVKGEIDACELRLRRGFPDKTDAATNRRWVTADTPPTSFPVIQDPGGRDPCRTGTSEAL